jgi:hypothetical protein
MMNAIGTTCEHCKALLLITPSGAVCSNGCENARIKTNINRRAIEKAWFWNWAMEKTSEAVVNPDGSIQVDGKKIKRGKAISSKRSKTSHIAWLKTDEGVKVFEFEFV